MGGLGEGLGWWAGNTHRVGDEANSVHPHVPGHGEGVDPVQRDFVLVLQQVSAVYRHLWATRGNFTT